MTKPKVEFIQKFDSSPCHKCGGWGLLRRLWPGITNKERKRITCPVCNGTGKWIEDNYIMVATTPEGQQIAFQTEGFC